MIETEKSENYFLTNDQLLEIYKTVIANIFLDSKNYSNPMVADGSYQNLKIITKGKEHEVSVANKNIRQVNNIIAKIFNTLDLQDLK